jgi:hypothetical protein
MRLGVSFIAPRQLGAVESIPGRQFLPSIDWRTGQSGADFFPVLAQPTVGDLEPLAHRTLSGASFGSLAQPRVMRGLRGRLLAHRTVQCTPDSPVNFSRTPSTKSRERSFHHSQPGAPDTVWCTTGQSGAPKLSRVLASRAKSFSIVFSLILALRQIC